MMRVRRTRWPSSPAWSVVFRIIWCNISEVFGVVSALRCDPSRTDHRLISLRVTRRIKDLPCWPRISLFSRRKLALPSRSSRLRDTPNTSETLRQIAIKATVIGELSDSFLGI
jgi:hypothetical protein